ncbi:hypothetical protein ACFW3Z_12425 [Nocardiopsis alba]|uniref:Uncharacterized protein n=1 Tax=Nocardiopsis alba TaxID=53437 RepID=A0A7K2ITW4_9ACTN|nr:MULTISPECIES: hypothetical protein [Nocardiopsis]MEC3893826.1 hypothetical protein [Nocardiopsis sp. LDBS1602]MYR33409.1 hypothetical protein [Nocardiopsis alba]
MGDFLSSVLPPGLIDVLSALIPPVVVATVFCTFVIKLLRKEMAPRRMDGSLVSEGAAGGGVVVDKGETGVDETVVTNKTSMVQGEERADSDGR